MNPIVVPTGLWVAFLIGVVVLLLLDLVVFNKSAHRVSLKEALLASTFFVSCALAVGGLIWWHLGSKAGLEYYTGYLVEQSLSVDNLFVFALLFRYFRVPPEYQHRVLFWGIFGAIAMRAIMIFAGIALLNRFEWLIYVFGAFLLYSGVKMLRPGDEPEDIDESRVLRFIRRLMPVAPGLHGHKLFVRMNNRLMATRLFLVLVMVELTDVVFAVDSIPAILGITRDTFIVFTSNIMAILGLRSLFFVLADFIERFKYLHYGLALVLVLIGAKMLVAHWYHMPTWLSLVLVLGTITSSVLLSLVATRGTPHHALPTGRRGCTCGVYVRAPGSARRPPPVTPSDAYRRPARAAAVETRVLGSVFRACAFVVTDEPAVAACVAEVRRRAPDATHHCTAFRLSPPSPAPTTTASPPAPRARPSCARSTATGSSKRSWW